MAPSPRAGRRLGACSSGVQNRRRTNYERIAISALRNGGTPVKKGFSACILAVLTASLISIAITPAYALGGCGPNRHRGWGGHCYWGGQHQSWCLRHTGHRAVPNGHGALVCYR